MKKTVKTLALLFVSSLVMMSCGGPEADAEEVCEMTCEVAALAEKVEAGDAEEKELEDAAKELEDLIKDLEKTYGEDGDASDEDKEAFVKAVEDCECDDAE